MGMLVLLAGAVVLAHHLGLTGKIGRVLLQVLSCPKCCVFWAVMAWGILSGMDVLETGAWAIILAYAAIWAELPLYYLTTIYDRIWQEINRSGRGKSRTSRFRPSGPAQNVKG